MIVTIDGLAAAGKSTVARGLAARLDLPYLDTGAMYRAVAWTALEQNVDLGDEQALLGVARRMKLEVDCGPTCTRVRVDGCDISEAIRSIAVSAALSRVARCSAVREILIEQQRRIGRTLGSFVTEGRDQGNVVFPNAEHRFVLEASLEERAERRVRELDTKGEGASLEAITDDLRQRDQVDSRQWKPLLGLGGGRVHVIDTTEMSVEEVVDRMVKLVRARPGP